MKIKVVLTVTGYSEVDEPDDNTFDCGAQWMQNIICEAQEGELEYNHINREVMYVKVLDERRWRNE